MIDHRIETFLTLCNEMNYRKVAEQLCMTQPAVTQHIQYLERLYDCKLFLYENKRLSLTEQGRTLERYARSMVALSRSTHEGMAKQTKTVVRIGATKTIGEYAIDRALVRLLSNPNYEVHLVVDNTKTLLAQLNQFALDLLLLEGHFEKDHYQYQRLSSERIVGICAVGHAFANREIALLDLFYERMVLRETGSGTRALFEQMLLNNGYSIDSLHEKSFVSSNRLIERVVEQGCAISFVYDVVPRRNANLATFTIAECALTHDFNYVFLNDTKAKAVIALLEE